MVRKSLVQVVVNVEVTVDRNLVQVVVSVEHNRVLIVSVEHNRVVGVKYNRVQVVRNSSKVYRMGLGAFVDSGYRGN